MKPYTLRWLISNAVALAAGFAVIAALSACAPRTVDGMHPATAGELGRVMDRRAATDAAVSTLVMEA